MKVALLSWPFFLFCEENVHDTGYFSKKINNKNDECYIDVVAKKWLKLHCFHCVCVCVGGGGGVLLFFIVLLTKNGYESLRE